MLNTNMFYTICACSEKRITTRKYGILYTILSVVKNTNTVFQFSSKNIDL